MSSTEKPTEGWGWLMNSPKEHYFVDGRSLCGRWLGLGIDKDLTDKQPANACAGCVKKLQKHKDS